MPIKKQPDIKKSFKESLIFCWVYSRESITKNIAVLRFLMSTTPIYATTYKIMKPIAKIIIYLLNMLFLKAFEIIGITNT